MNTKLRLLDAKVRPMHFCQTSAKAGSQTETKFQHAPLAETAFYRDGKGVMVVWPCRVKAGRSSSRKTARNTICKS